MARQGRLTTWAIEVDTPEEVRAATRRLADVGLEPDVHEGTTCCYAVQDKAWVKDPDGAPWEVYTVLADRRADADGLGGCRPAARSVRTPSHPVRVAERTREHPVGGDAE